MFYEHEEPTGKYKISLSQTAHEPTLKRQARWKSLQKQDA